MGCGSSNVAGLSGDDSDYLKYTGYGSDYVNYSYYKTYYSERSEQDIWTDYSKSVEYQRQQSEPNGPDANTNSVAGDAYFQYKSWYDHQPHKHTKTISSQEALPTDIIVKETEPTVNLVIEHSDVDLRKEGGQICIVVVL